MSDPNPVLPVSLALTPFNFKGRDVANNRLLMPLVIPGLALYVFQPGTKQAAAGAMIALAITFLVRTGRDRSIVRAEAHSAADILGGKRVRL